MKDDNFLFLDDGGIMGKAIQSHDWSTTSLGPLIAWPPGLRLATGIMVSNPLPMFITWGADFVQLYNDAFLHLFDSTNGPDLGALASENLSSLWDVTGPLLAGVMAGQLMPALRLGLQTQHHGLHETKYVRFACSAIRNEKEIAGVLVTVIEMAEPSATGQALHDIKEQLEKVLQTSRREKEWLRSFFMQAPVGICILEGPSLICGLVNPTLKEFFPGRQLEGNAVLTAFPELRDSTTYNQLQEVYYRQHSFSGKEVSLSLQPGDTSDLANRFFNFMCKPRINTAGKTDGILVLTYEVTDVVKARQQLQLSESRFRNIVEQSPVPILVTIGDDMVFAEFNEAMLNLLDKDESIRGKKAYDIMPELQGQAIMRILYHTYRSGEKWQGNELPIALKRGGEIAMGYFNITYKPFVKEGKIIGVLQSAVDITDQVLARKALEKTEDTLRLSMKAGRVGFFDLDLEKNDLYWDERCRELFGASHDEPISYEKDFEGGLHPEDRDRIIKEINEYTMVQDLSNGAYDVQYRTVGTSDGKVRWVRATGKAYFSLNKKPVRFIGTVIDITETKANELLKNDFIGMVSHELKTPLASLKAYLQILQSDQLTGTYPGLATMLQKADNQANKMNNLIRGFLDVARLESGKIVLYKTSFDLLDLVEETIQDVMITSLGHTIKVEKTSPLVVVADRDKIASVIMNLLTNAIKYSKTGSTIIITTAVDTDEVQVKVADEGIGIRQVHLPHLFERFYRVNDSVNEYVSGFGIGLYLSAEIIRRHGGKMGVESEFGKGSVFIFSIPVTS